MKSITYTLVLLFLIFKGYGGECKIYPFFEKDFERDVLPTESTAYDLIKKRPIQSNVNYLAVPWAWLINSKQLDKANSIKVKLNGGFTICQHIYFEKIIPILQKIGIDTLFTPHVGEKKYPIKVLPFPHFPKNAPNPSTKTLWYSFIGLSNHPVRNNLFNFYKTKNNISYIKKIDKWGLALPPNEFKRILSATRFSLCPRGTGASTIRFWESLKAGSIPVLLSDAFIFPKGFDWSSCVVKIPEKNVTQIERVLTNISHTTENKMRTNCYKAFKQFSGPNFVKVIRDHYERKN